MSAVSNRSNEPHLIPLTHAAEAASNAELEAVMRTLNPDLYRLAKENTMPPHTYTRTVDRFLLNDGLPERIIVRDITPEDHATRICAVIADYGWAETILAGDCYDHTANDLAWAVGEALDVPIEEIAL